MRLHIFINEDWQLAVQLAFATCGCKHFTVCIGTLVARLHFGKCRNASPFSEL
jgi:hypothetical protein